MNTSEVLGYLEFRTFRNLSTKLIKLFLPCEMILRIEFHMFPNDNRSFHLPGISFDLGPEGFYLWATDRNDLHKTKFYLIIFRFPSVHPNLNKIAVSLNNIANPPITISILNIDKAGNSDLLRCCFHRCENIIQKISKY